MKAPTILATAITPPSVRYFDGEQITPPPVVEESGDPNAGLLDFKAPDISEMDLGDGKHVEPVVTPPVVTPPVVPPKGDVKPPDVKPPVKPPVAPVKGEEGPAKLLREELEAKKVEIAEMKTRLDSGDPRVKELERERDEIKEQIKAKDTKLSDYERRLALADPAVTERLSTMDKGYSTDADRFYSSVPELEQNQVHALVREMHGLPFGKPEYRQARADFEAKVNKLLVGEEKAAEGKESNKLGRALDFIDKTREFSLERYRVNQEIHDSAIKLQRESETKKFTDERSWLDQQLTKAKFIPEGLETRDPFHPRVMLEKFAATLKPEEAEEYQRGIKEFVELALVGPKPIDERDHAGMTPEAMEQSRTRQIQAHHTARGQAAEVIYNGLRALRMMPALVREISRLREKVKADVLVTPPDPTGGDPKPGAPATDDLAGYKAPDLDKMDF